MREELPPRTDVGAILEILKRHDVDFMLVGGLAGMAHGSSYPTYDVDIAYERSPRNLERLAEALLEMEATLRGAPADLPFICDAETLRRGLNFTFQTKHGPFDVIGELRGVGPYVRVARAAVRTRIEGVQIDVISLDHLIAMKSAAGRDKDKLMVSEYIAIADERKRLAEEDQN